MKIFDSTLIHPIFDVESIGDGPRVPRAHLEVVLTQLLAARARALYPNGEGGHQRIKATPSFQLCVYILLSRFINYSQ